MLREDLSSHEQLQAWLRHRQFQHILQLGNLFHFLLSLENEEALQIPQLTKHLEYVVRLSVELSFPINVYSHC